MDSFVQAFSVEGLAGLEIPQDVHLSPSAKQVVYSTKPLTRALGPEISSLWIADVGEAHSARRLTPPGCNDRCPQWSPCGRMVAFVSDRSDPGSASCAIWVIRKDGSKMIPLTEVNHKKPIQELQWSRCGEFIAFLSRDQDLSEGESTMLSSDDVHVYGSKWDSTRLRILEVKSRSLTWAHIEVADVPMHICHFTWTHTADYIVFVAREAPDMHSLTNNRVALGVFNQSTGETKIVCKFPGTIYSLQSTDTGVFIVAGVRSSLHISARTVYHLSYDFTRWTRVMVGDTIDAVSLIARTGVLAAHVLSGRMDEIRLCHTAFHPPTVLYRTFSEIIPRSWDLRRTVNGGFVLAAVTSSADLPRYVQTIQLCNIVEPVNALQPSELVSVTVSAIDNLFGSWSLTTTKTVNCISADGGSNLEGVFVAQIGQFCDQALPTIVVIHDGPYDRWANRFGCETPFWVPALLVSGDFGVFVPNYRGSSSYGEGFIASARFGKGTVDYDDILLLVDAAIESGYIDKDRIIVAGWGYGGFLSYLCAVRNGFDRQSNRKPWSFKGAIAGAGVSDWDMLTMTTDAPGFYVELAGGAPWEAHDRHSVNTRHGSPIWEMAHSRNRIPPMLILHGEEDKYVPVSQAIAFHRGCLKHRYICEMALYPREGHEFTERAHVIDMLNRVLNFCGMHLLSRYNINESTGVAEEIQRR